MPYSYEGDAATAQDLLVSEAMRNTRLRNGLIVELEACTTGYVSLKNELSALTRSEEDCLRQNSLYAQMITELLSAQEGGTGRRRPPAAETAALVRFGAADAGPRLLAAGGGGGSAEIVGALRPFHQPTPGVDERPEGLRHRASKPQQETRERPAAGGAGRGAAVARPLRCPSPSLDGQPALRHRVVRPRKTLENPAVEGHEAERLTLLAQQQEEEAAKTTSQLALDMAEERPPSVDDCPEAHPPAPSDPATAGNEAERLGLLAQQQEEEAAKTTSPLALSMAEAHLPSIDDCPEAHPPQAKPSDPATAGHEAGRLGLLAQQQEEEATKTTRQLASNATEERPPPIDDRPEAHPPTPCPVPAGHEAEQLGLLAQQEEEATKTTSQLALNAKEERPPCPEAHPPQPTPSDPATAGHEAERLGLQEVDDAAKTSRLALTATKDRPPSVDDCPGVQPVTSGHEAERHRLLAQQEEEAATITNQLALTATKERPPSVDDCPEAQRVASGQRHRLLTLQEEKTAKTTSQLALVATEDRPPFIDDCPEAHPPPPTPSDPVTAGHEAERLGLLAQQRDVLRRLEEECAAKRARLARLLSEPVPGTCRQPAPARAAKRQKAASPDPIGGASVRTTKTRLTLNEPPRRDLPPAAAVLPESVDDWVESLRQSHGVTTIADVLARVQAPPRKASREPSDDEEEDSGDGDPADGVAGHASKLFEKLRALNGIVRLAGEVKGAVDGGKSPAARVADAVRLPDDTALDESGAADSCV
ncbi:hypothetical protein DIPPA_32483 [Diplonema papillatum]|nr:hypothetical protein DIPPA_32483 [Diplonema papillatum]